MTIVDSHPSAALWAGYVVTALVALFLIVDAAQMLFSPKRLRAEYEKTGFPEQMTTPLGIIILVCALLYTFPPTAVVGAILTTGFLGGAVSTHFRLGRVASPPQIISLVLGAATWAGLWLRSPELRNILPLTGW